MQRSPSIPGAATVAGLLIGALGMGVQWASGVKYTEGIIILLVGAVVVGLAPWRWVPGVGALFGLLFTVVFLISPTGIPNFLGRHGTSVAIGSWIQMAGVLTALLAGVIATGNNYRKPTRVPR